MITINESGNFDVTDNHPDEIDVPSYANEQELYAAKLAEVRRITQLDRRS